MPYMDHMGYKCLMWLPTHQELTNVPGTSHFRGQFCQFWRETFGLVDRCQPIWNPMGTVYNKKTPYLSQQLIKFTDLFSFGCCNFV